MADDIVARIKEATDIVELVGDSVRLIRKGRNYSGLCPFHDEKTPSFIVTPDRQSWHCFGCGKGGDVFSFVMEKEGMSFPEALEYLGRRAGIEIPRRGSSRRSTDLYGVMELAADFFKKALRGPAGAVGKGYLARRNMTPADWDAFELGWAPAGWRALNDALRAEGATQEQLQQCGLVILGEKGCYDRFRGRVIFPIRNVSGRPIAFGGRIVDGEGAKYLNSPEGPLYNKKDNLYLLDRAKGAIREKGRSILVEGYMDAIRLHMHGHKETVASLGTALTEEQAALLKRFADRCYICYDADTAGQNATLRGMYVLQRAGLSVYVVSFPGGKDPDEMLQTPGGDAEFDRALETARPLVLHHIGIYRARIPEIGEARAGGEMLESFAQLPPVELAPYIQEVAHALGISAPDLREELRRLRRSNPSAFARKPDQPLSGRDLFSGENPDGEAPQKPCDISECAMLALLWNSPELCLHAPGEKVLPLFLDPRTQSVAMALLSGQSPASLEQQWLECGDTMPLSLISLGEHHCDTLPEKTLEDQWRQLYGDLSRRALSARYAVLKDRMYRGEATPDEMSEYLDVARKLKK